MRMVVAGVLERGGKVLVGQRSHPVWAAGQWEFPGGKVEEGERQEDALAREWLEELGVRVQVGPEVYRQQVQTPLGLVVLLALRVDLLAGEAEPQPLEHRSLAWVLPQELERLPLLQSNRPIAAALAAQT
ncbi:NUDIX domain-containing protein [Deinococcus sp. KNUC1210]|uniref:(deoxy)nucleoside triphosphate pyrophosphohydrolase n=1 Tax=Deinococcus sp. KNUC1210 TaxID=2917691 RepID=UPI001EEFF5BB|nr:NUDIX domain-containing protein [Deinococcus sp. KNUC1210]ULH14922.1 NUDIX domain-containing protein [Deinococcus sp. KNUC1210]